MSARFPKTRSKRETGCFQDHRNEVSMILTPDVYRLGTQKGDPDREAIQLNFRRSLRAIHNGAPNTRSGVNSSVLHTCPPSFNVRISTLDLRKKLDSMHQRERFFNFFTHPEKRVPGYTASPRSRARSQESGRCVPTRFGRLSYFLRTRFPRANRYCCRKPLPSSAPLKGRDLFSISYLRWFSSFLSHFFFFF